MGSSWTRARTHVPCIDRRAPNHGTTREAPEMQILSGYSVSDIHVEILSNLFLEFRTEVKLGDISVAVKIVLQAITRRV